MRGESVPQSCLAGVREVAWGAAVYEQAALPPSGRLDQVLLHVVQGRGRVSVRGRIIPMFGLLLITLSGFVNNKLVCSVAARRRACAVTRS